MTDLRRPRHALAKRLAVFAFGGLIGTAFAQSSFEIKVLSSRPDTISAGDALVQVRVPPNVSLQQVIVLRNETDITSAFRGVDATTLQGLVSGLNVGANALAVQTRSDGRIVWKALLTNHPVTGPIFSGPRQTPFICETQSFTLPVTGGNLGTPLDANCSAPTRTDYVYMSLSTHALAPLPDPSTRPVDLATTTTKDGRTVNYIVRVETGTINRAIYQTAVLHDPLIDAAPDPWHAPAGWNGRLIYSFGGDCKAGYHQATSTGGVLNEPFSQNAFIALGYAMASSTLNVFGNDCNDVISAETLSLVKERFIERYGVPKHTIGYGASGGSMQQHLIAQNYPGLLDAIMPSASYPDIVTVISPVVDCSLLKHAFGTANQPWTSDQKRAVSGFFSWNTCEGNWDTGGQTGYSPGWIVPTAAGKCDPAVPRALIYDPVSNRGGVRCTVQDTTVNVYGRDDATGFARRPLDNTGVQYGLSAFNAGVISADQFIELNEKIGGYDVDGNIVAARSNADVTGIALAYKTGRVSGGGGLSSIPIIDVRPYLDNASNIHVRHESFVTRARLVAANGDAANQVLLTGYFVGSGDGSFASMSITALRLIDQWLDNIDSDVSNRTAAEKVRFNKPAEATDTCWTASNQKIVEPATYNGPGQCNQLYPSYADPRIAAGSPVANNVLKCQLKPLDLGDYARALSAPQVQRLMLLFSNGVCDYSKPGVEQQSIAATWLAYPTPGAFFQLK